MTHAKNKTVPSTNHSDRELGMDRNITRRDILHGFGALTTAALLPTSTLAKAVLSSATHTHSPYPPALSGYRGNHIGSFETAHQLARRGRRDWGPLQQADEGIYDLAVVGAGISGLAAAHFYQKQHPGARILILDNHDDFGGHAKRNEFQTGGRTLIGYGGAQSLEDPSYYSDVVKGMLSDIGVHVQRFNQAYDQGFYQRNGLGAGLHFNRESWGVDRVIPFSLGDVLEYMPLAPSKLSIEEAVAQMPISAPARQEFIRMLKLDDDQIPEIPVGKKWAYLQSISYRDFLGKHLGIHDEEIFSVLQDLASDFGVGIEAVTAARAISYSGLPGWDAAGLPEDDESDAYIYHFPDGNASIARLLVRKMIPAVARGNNMEDIVTANFDYSKLDMAGSDVRLRLNSTVIRVLHDGNPKSSSSVQLTYMNDKKACQVQARACILACNNSIIPYLCPELPEAQRQALSFQVKTPILYTNVALSNWRAWKNLGVGAVVSPGSYHINAMLDFPVSIGAYEYSSDPDQPVIVHMERFPHRSNEGLTAHEQFREGRKELMKTSWKTIERNIRSQLASMLAGAGFDPASDITGITVNRWAHGYASSYNPLFDPVYKDRNDPRYPHMLARQQFGRISIANSDSAAMAMMEAAVEQGYRAAGELA